MLSAANDVTAAASKSGRFEKGVPRGNLASRCSKHDAELRRVTLSQLLAHTAVIQPFKEDSEQGWHTFLFVSPLRHIALAVATNARQPGTTDEMMTEIIQLAFDLFGHR